jgi:hypothetical protein
MAQFSFTSTRVVRRHARGPLPRRPDKSQASALRAQKRLTPSHRERNRGGLGGPLRCVHTLPAIAGMRGCESVPGAQTKRLG